MSHITRVKTSLKDGDVLKEALVKSGYRVRERKVIYSEYSGRPGVQVDILAEKEGQCIGFSRTGSPDR